MAPKSIAVAAAAVSLLLLVASSGVAAQTKSTYPTLDAALKANAEPLKTLIAAIGVGLMAY